MKKILVLAISLVGTLGMAVNWQDVDELKLIGSDGQLVGQAQLEDNKFMVYLSEAYEGLVSFVADGEQVEGFVRDGQVILISNDGSVNLQNTLEEAGLELAVTYVQDEELWDDHDDDDMRDDDMRDDDDDDDDDENDDDDDDDDN